MWWLEGRRGIKLRGVIGGRIKLRWLIARGRRKLWLGWLIGRRSKLRWLIARGRRELWVGWLTRRGRGKLRLWGLICGRRIKLRGVIGGRIKLWWLERRRRELWLRWVVVRRGD